MKCSLEFFRIFIIETFVPMLIARMHDTNCLSYSNIQKFQPEKKCDKSDSQMIYVQKKRITYKSL